MSSRDQGAQRTRGRGALVGNTAFLRWRAIATALMVGALVLLGALTASAEEVSLGAPPNASDARGTTFLASVTRFYTTEVQGHTLHFLLFHVERVYAGASHGIPGEAPRPGDGKLNEIVEPGADLAIYQQIDGLNSLDVGATYLVSTADIDTPVVGNSVVWSAHGDALSWVQMSPVAGSGDPRFAEVANLRQAIALMVTDLPPTDSSLPTSEDSTGLVMLVGGMTGLAVWRRMRTRLAGSVLGEGFDRGRTTKW